MISKSFNSRQQLEELSFNKNKSMPSLKKVKNLSQTHTQGDDDEDFNDETYNSNDESKDSILHETQSYATRDMLLLKCRDAIESLHQEIEEERAEKARINDENIELSRYVNDLQLQDQEKNFRMQKLTEDSIQMQSDIMVLNKEKERFQYEKEDLERQVRSLEQVSDEFKKITGDKQHLLDQLRKAESQIQVLSVENKQLDISSQVVRREKEELQRDLAECRDQLYNEQRKAEITYKSQSEQMQDLFVKENEKREAEVKKERDERRLAEKEYQSKLDELQLKMERCIRECEKESKDEYDTKLSDLISKNKQEVAKYVAQIQQTQAENQSLEHRLKNLESENHSRELKIIEITEQLKQERHSTDRLQDAMGKNKLALEQKYIEEEQKLRQEIFKLDLQCKSLEKEVKTFEGLEDKFEDMQAECLTLRLTNDEYKKTLSQKVKEIMSLTKQLECERRATIIREQQAKEELDFKSQQLSKVTSEKNDLKETLTHMETIISNRDKSLKESSDQWEEERELLGREMRGIKKECQEWQEKLKQVEQQKMEQTKRYSTLEEAYKRDTGLFRTETIKRDEEWDDERQRFERDSQRAKLQHDQTLEFLLSIKKDLSKLGKGIGKKQEQFGCMSQRGTREAENVDNNSGDRYALITLIDGTKRAIETMNKRIDSYMSYSSNSMKVTLCNDTISVVDYRDYRAEAKGGFQSRDLTPVSKDRLYNHNMGEMYSTLVSQAEHPFSTGRL